MSIFKNQKTCTQQQDKKRDKKFFQFFLSVKSCCSLLTGTLILLFFAGSLCSNSGCRTPFWATDNKYLLYLPGAERRSDEIPGVMKAWKRRELIREKGIKGANASEKNKEILVAQLTKEYRSMSATNPNIRREIIVALGRIGDEKGLPILIEALHDEELLVQIAAVNQLGSFSEEFSSTKTMSQEDIDQKIAVPLAELYQENAFSVTPGEEAENAGRKDIRLAVLRNLAKTETETAAKTFLDALTEPLDDGMIRFAAMDGLKKTTSKNYGYDYELWCQYAEFVQGKRSTPPEEKSAADRLSIPALPFLR